MRLHRVVVVAVLAAVLGAGVALAVPPYKAGQVVVTGAPADFPGYSVVKYLPHANLTVLAVEKGNEWGHIQKFRAMSRRAGLNFVASKFGTVNDPYYSPYQWHITRMQAEQVWDVTTGGRVTVAVVDTGLKLGGPDGIGCTVAGYDVVNGDTDPTDGDGHGTHVSGTIAQASNNGVGTAGLAYGACIMPVKVLDDSGSGTFADIAEGIVWAVDKGAKVINMSLGIDAAYHVTNDATVDPALDYAYERGVTVVVAAGNDGNRKNVSYPAIYPTVIAVGATDYNDALCRYSNRGEGLDVVAPGGNTSVDANKDGYVDGVLQETYIASSGGWSYFFFQGTSMASPHVAAAVALLYATNPAITPAEVYQRLTSTAKDLGTAGFDTTFGYGLVQAYDAVVGGGGGGCTDADGDGFCATEGDCNDNDASIYPGALEVCGDGVDNDCDGQIDEDCGGVCKPAGTACASNAECCSFLCHPKKLTCK